MWRFGHASFTALFWHVMRWFLPLSNSAIAVFFRCCMVSARLSRRFCSRGRIHRFGSL
jgi:hypothetical protein